jgi:polysaccharide biosynthesis/export protein
MNIYNLGGGKTCTAIGLLLVCLMNVLFISCSTPQNITYFKDVPDTVKQKIIDQAAYYTPKIQPDDILQVTIQTLDPGSSALLNQQSAGGTLQSMGTGNTGNNISAPASNINGYLVDSDGYVILPIIGKILVKGKTTNIVRDEIRAKAAEFYKDPIVAVRLANFKITVLGEVTRPSSYVMPNEKVSILDALGMAGDLTIYGKRENVLLIRENNGKKEFVRFNLNESKLFASPYFYLQQGDVLYVEPNKSKVASTDATQLRKLAILTSVLTVLVVIVSRVNF